MECVVKNLRLGLKIGMGFSALLIIVCALGAMAVLSMRGVSSNAKSMAAEDIPEVGFANDIERHVQMLTSAMQGFSLSENPAYRQTSIQELARLKEYLDAVNAHATQYPRLSHLKKSAETINAQLAGYGEISGKIEAIIKEIQGLREKMNASALALVKNATEYLQSQNVKFTNEIERLSAVQALQARLKKINLIAESLRIVDEIRIKNFKAQAANDPGIMQEALTQFAGILKNLFQLKDITLEEEDLKSLAAIQENVMRYKKAMQILMNDWLSLGKLNEESGQAAGLIMEESKRMAVAGMENVKDVSMSGVRQLDAARNVMLGGLILALIIGTFLSFFIARGITRPVLTSLAFAESVAEGDLDGRLDIAQKDEIGRLADSLRKMVATLKARILEAGAKTEEAEKAAAKAQEAMIEAETAQAQAVAKSEAMEEAAIRLRHVAEITTSASEELSAQIEESSRGAGVQAQRAAETATAMEEMNATVMEVAKSASTAAEISDNARETAKGGADIVNQVVAGIVEAQSQAAALKEDMVKLGEQAEGIGRIMSVISDIADQTNLLALNAAIEAARAGEAGRGFAVVADEVRKLAEKTMNATKEVGDAIRGIQDGTRKNMVNVDRSVQAIGDAASLAGQSGEALNAIVHMVEGASDQVRAIAAASEEQSAASEQISRSIEEVNAISKETADGMSQAARAVAELAGQSQELKTLIEDMTGGESAGAPLALSR